MRKIVIGASLSLALGVLGAHAQETPLDKRNDSSMSGAIITPDHDPTGSIEQKRKCEDAKSTREEFAARDKSAEPKTRCPF